MTMTNESLIRLSDLNTADYNLNDNGIYSPVGSTAYGYNLGQPRPARLPRLDHHFSE